MRTYLQAVSIPPGSTTTELAMVCNCGKFKRLAEFVDKAVRPNRIQSINLLRLMQWAGEWMSEHSSCPDQPKPADDTIPF